MTETPDAEEIIRMDSLDIYDNGRIRIPKDIRDHFGLVERQLLRMRVAEDSDGAHFNAKLVSGGRVTIPERIREKYDVGDGDDIDIELMI